MNFEEATLSLLPAYRYLESGAVVRYDPRDGSIRRLAYPATPSTWTQASGFAGHVPAEGWCHVAGCECPTCASMSRAAENMASDRLAGTGGAVSD